MVVRCAIAAARGGHDMLITWHVRWVTASYVVKHKVPKPRYLFASDIWNNRVYEISITSRYRHIWFVK